MTLGTFETPSVRITRLRSALDSTAQSMGDTVSQSVDLEARRRAMADSLRRFREIERQPSAITREPVGGRLFDVPTGLEPAKFQPSPSPSGRFVDRLEPGRPVPEELIPPPIGLSLQRKSRTGEPLTPEELKVAFRAGYNISYSTGQPRIGIDPTPAQREALETGVSPDAPEFPPFDVGAPAGEPTFPGVAGRIPGLRTPAELGATIGTLGVGGPLIGPATAVTGSGGAFAGGEIGEAFGGPTGRIAGEVVGGLGGGLAGGLAARPLAGAVREAVTDPALRRTLAAEAGGGPLRGGEGLVRQPTPSEEVDVLREFLARTPKGGRVPATTVDKLARDVTFAQQVNAGRYPFPTESAIGKGSMESVQEAIAVGRRLGYSETDIGAYLRKNYELPSGSIADLPPAGPLRGGEEVNPHIAQGDPGPPPPPKEPPSGRPTPDEPEFGRIQEVAIKNEPVEETLLRRHDGAINTAKTEAQIEVTDGNKLLRDAEMGQNFRGTVVPKAGQTEEFDELYRFLHNPSKVQSGELVVPERLRPMYDKLRAQTEWEQTARIDFDPDMALAEDYFFRGWKPPEGMFTGEARGALGRKPGFKLPRVDATYDEMRAAGFEPLFWNPFEQQRYSRLMGVKYREQMKLIEDIKVLELALPHDGGPVPQGWRVPKVGPAFEGKPYGIIDTAGNPRPMFTRRWAVPDSLANRLENAYGVTPDLGKVGAFGKTVDLQKAIDKLVFIPKRAKLIASVFQHVDFTTRSHIGAWAGFTNALRHGQPVAAVGHLAKWPQSAGTILRATVSPSYRQNLRRLAVDSTDLFADRPGLSMKSVSEAGLSTQDVTIFPDIDTLAREAAQGSRLKAALGQIADLERINRQGLFQGVYPAAILTDVKNNIAPMMVRNYPDENVAQLSGRIAKAANTKYSTIPGSASVVQNRFMRNFLVRFFFSLGEQEGLLRAFTGAIRGENAAFWREHWLGAYIGLISAANVIHFASTGEPLPLSRFSPISKDKWGPLPFGYNTDFAAPNIPLTGRSGTQVTLDLVGQLDTAFRILDPASFLSARESVPVRAGLNQITGKDFFGAPIDTVGPGGVISRTSQLISDLFAPIGFGQASLQLARDNIAGAENVIQPGEDRLGIQGTLTQATGVNLRAETTPQLLRRIRAEVMREMEIEGAYEDVKATDSPLANEIDDEVEKRIGGELELRRETAEIRGQTTPQGQGFEAIETTRGEQQAEQLTDDANLNSGQWTGDVWREKFRDRQRDFFNRREQIKADFQIQFDEKKAPSGSVNAAIDAYFDVNVDNFVQPDGEVDWDGFFTARDVALKGLSVGDKQRVMRFIRKFDTATVTQFRKAQEVVDEVFETPKYVGLSLKEGEEVDRILFEIVPRMQTAQLRQGVEMERGQAVMAAISFVQDPDVARFLLTNFGPRLSVRRRRRRGRTVTLEAPNVVNPERDEILIENQDLLALFYPDLLERQLSREQEAGLGETAFAAIQR